MMLHTGFGRVTDAKGKQRRCSEHREQTESFPMEAENVPEDQGGVVPAGSAAVVAAAPIAVQGVPWWGGVGLQTVPQIPPSSNPPALSLPMDHPTKLGAPIVPMGFSLPCSTQQSAFLPEGSVSGEIQPTIGATDIMPTGIGDFAHPHSQSELGHTMASAAYPSYADPYFGGMMAVYGTHAMMYPHVFHQSRMPLPSEITEEEPVYVNAKQYNGIMRRRQSRAKAESENKLVKARKPYLHESRHLHAMRRARGCGGRFLNTKGDTSKASSDCTKSSEGHCSQGGSTPESQNTGRMEQGVMTIIQPEYQGMEVPTNGSFSAAELDQAGYCHTMMFQHSPHSLLREAVLHSRKSEDVKSRKGGVIPKSTQQRAIAMQ